MLKTTTNKLQDCDHYVGLEWVRDYYIGEMLLPISRILGDKLKGANHLLDRRKHRMHHFNFCPICGEKINYKILKKMIKEKILEQKIKEKVG